MLHHRRVQERRYAEREAQGENVWNERVTSTAQRRLGTLVEIAFSRLTGTAGERISAAVQLAFKLDLGIDLGWHTWTDEYQAVIYNLTRFGDDPDLYPSLVEATLAAADPYYDNMAALEERINGIFGEERIGFRLVEGQMIPFDSMELHTAVVEPTIRLLHGSQFSAVEASYAKALHEITADPSDAITDAGTALQEMLEALGCSGNSLGPLIKDAKAKRILAPHDPTLGDGISKILDWVSADRSEKGDGHHTSSATEADAWLAVHVVGSLILRLADPGSTRGT